MIKNRVKKKTATDVINLANKKKEGGGGTPKEKTISLSIYVALLKGVKCISFGLWVKSPGVDPGC